MSTNGMKTAFWGPNAWNFLFSAIAGTYPIKFDPNNKTHQKQARGFTQLLNSLKETLPCIYCRRSYVVFLKELPLKEHMESRASLFRWLYLIHDKVNQKLIDQEQECYDNELKKLKALLAGKRISVAKYKQQVLAIKSIKITKPSPPLQTIVDKFERQRAGCNAQNKKCM